MPKVIHFATEEGAKVACRADPAAALVRDSGAQVHRSVPRSPSQCPEELAAKSVSLLWRRLFLSYAAFTQQDAEPFVVFRGRGDLSSRLASHSTACAPRRDALDGVADVDWAGGFPCSDADELIVHFYLNNEPFDTFSWVIAFCLIDELHLAHYVRERVRQSSLLRGSAPSSLTCGAGGGCSVQQVGEHDSMFRLYSDRIFEALFTAYTLALKMHLDYSVTLNYLVSLLPHDRHCQKRILRSTAALERRMLHQLKFNCFVHQQHVVQLLDRFLTATERSYILFSVLR